MRQAFQQSVSISMSKDSVHSERRDSSGNIRRGTANAPARKDSANVQDTNTVKVKGRNKLPSQARMEAAVQRRKEREKEEEEKRKQGELTGSDRRASGAATPPQRSSSIHTPEPDDITLGAPGGKTTIKRKAVKLSSTKDVLRAYSSDPSVKDEDSSYAMLNLPERSKRRQKKRKDNDEEDKHMTAEEKLAAGRNAVSELREQMGNESSDTEVPSLYGSGIPRSSSPKPMNGTHCRTNSRATLDTHNGHGPSEKKEHGRNGSVSSVSNVAKERRDSNVSIKAPTIPASIPRHMREDSEAKRSKFREVEEGETGYIPPPVTSVSHSSPSRDGKKARKLTGQTDEGERPKRQKGKNDKNDKNDAAR
ncbi:uncharacterized protein FOMMEDRAFT_159153 [Fomitiporia mediterranea MF3/22]|uniref:uncharacterized protein n=1 Tax=Fomitiporia mediterranea (strain MF3/22) TaxID=694068 RepID=UPI0004409A5E|nr:uncharacterized protein FOMMEDRAFT_159153 [Fomitiporia mediterranea MF3/22]EJD00459.1 hypothetical protein FOMMEDRAFT_159153 [Fomitiporia mediterranea MF3/22]